MLSANDLIASIVLAMPKKWASDRPRPELASGRSPLIYTPFSELQDIK